MFVLLALLALGWVFGAIWNWDEIASRPVRLAYVIADFTIVIPTGVIAGLGLRAKRPWARRLFAFALGALLFDTAHGVIYLWWDNYFGVPWAVALVLLIVLVGYVAYAFRAVEVKP